MPSRVEDYALIGDCQSAALVGRNGSIDWLCLPRFDSPACFAALLGTPEKRRWLLAPAGNHRVVERRYRPETLVLETEYRTDTGEIVLVDCMPPRHTGFPHVTRSIECRRGRVDVRMEFVLRFDYGARIPWVRRVEEGLAAVAGPDAVRLRTPVDLRGENFHTVASFTVTAGQRIPFILTWHPAHLPPSPPADAESQRA
jgi:GH15 family glucan-1,4-alpha-glucosidase